MITKEQIESIAKLYTIDSFTIMREYLQLIFLSYLYQAKEGKAIYFKGGTAIRLLFGSPRFSEDLDFSTFYNPRQIKDMIKKLEVSIQREIKELRIILLYTGRETTRFRIKYHSSSFKYPMIIRLDFHHVKKIGKTTISPLITKYPIVIFPLISHLTAEGILAEKIKALAGRSKGRDFFDVWYLLEKGIGLKYLDRKLIIKRIKQYPDASIKRDLAQFLPKSQREIAGLLKEKLLEKISLSTYLTFV